MTVSRGYGVRVSICCCPQEIPDVLPPLLLLPRLDTSCLDRVSCVYWAGSGQRVGWMGWATIHDSSVNGESKSATRLLTGGYREDVICR